MTEVVVIAHWQTTEEHLDEVLQLLAELVPQSLAEPGCVGYEALQDAEAPTSLTLIERYRDRAALDAHREAPHFQALVVGRIVPLLTDRRVELLRGLER